MLECSARLRASWRFSRGSSTSVCPSFRCGRRSDVGVRHRPDRRLSHQEAGDQVGRQRCGPPFLLCLDGVRRRWVRPHRGASVYMAFFSPRRSLYDRSWEELAAISERISAAAARERARGSGRERAPRFQRAARREAGQNRDAQEQHQDLGAAHRHLPRRVRGRGGGTPPSPSRSPMRCPRGTAASCCASASGRRAGRATSSGRPARGDSGPRAPRPVTASPASSHVGGSSRTALRTRRQCPGWRRASACRHARLMRNDDAFGVGGCN